MKKVYAILVLLLFSVSNAVAQLKFKAGFVAGPTSNSIDIVIQPTVNFNGYLTNVIFILQIPVGAMQPTITKTSLTPYFVFSAASDLPVLPNEGGYRTFGFAAVNASNITPVGINAGVNYPVLRLTFNGGAVTPTDIRLSHLADGGPATLYQNYIEANAVGPGTGDYTNYVQMFFGGLVMPVSPFPDEGTGYSSYQYSQIAQILPVSWLSFNAVKKDNDALLNWVVANENANHHYEVLRSSDGINYTTIAVVNKSTNGSTAYNYTDIGINNLSSKILYYRIKQVDIDGKSSYSDIRFVTIDKKGETLITIFPNPVTEGFYVSITFTNRDNSSRVKLNLISATGQFITSKEITTLQASNYYFNIKGKALAAGEYFLQIIFKGETIETIKLLINK